MLTIKRTSNPVELYGDKTLSLERLSQFFVTTDANFSAVQVEVYHLAQELMETKIQNKQMAQLLNWIAVTNPQVLDEFQTTATAFEKLVPRNSAGQDEPCRAPSDV
jgi:hypothetical protein